MTPLICAEWVEHHLRLFGFALEAPGRVVVKAAPSADEARSAVQRGAVFVALQPDAQFCAAFGVGTRPIAGQGARLLGYRLQQGKVWCRLRTLHSLVAYEHPSGEAVVEADGSPAWLWLAIEGGAILFVGTDLGRDLLRYRQGDPAAVAGRDGRAAWGFEFERPGYLYEKQLEGEAPSERHADWWCEALSDVLTRRGSIPRAEMLPGGAAGAIILTGDDDQAQLEKYAEQLALIDGTPITYFLHPLTRHDRRSIAKMKRRGNVDLGLHPDALDRPAEYGALLREQSEWFHRLTGERPVSVRNHGFLSDGYWGHLEPWLREGIRISSNIPGLDGRVVNGSLLPARMVHPAEGTLSVHWSLLTAIGDGIIPILEMTPEAARNCVMALVRSVKESGVPGIVVLNLHPQNVTEARSMHEAVTAARREGFIALTMRDCLEWFAARDDGKVPGPIGRPQARGWAHSLQRMLGLQG